VAPSTAWLDLREPISRLSGYLKSTDIVSSSEDASSLKKQNFMSDKKKQLFSFFLPLFAYKALFDPSPQL
jgi:hypothetical protein